MPRRITVERKPEPPNVNVQVQMPSNQPETPKIQEEKSPTWFWDLLRELPKDKWGNIYSVMIWRLDPKVPNQPGSKGYLCEVFDAISLQWMKDNYGGGKFRCILQKNGRFQTTHDFDIIGQPKFDLSRENPHGVIANNGGGAGNEKLLQEFVGVLRDELQRTREASGNPAGTQQVVEMLSTASEKAMEIVTKQTPSHVDATAQLANLVNIVKGLIPQQQPAPGLGLDALLLKPLIEKLLTPVDPLAQVSTFLAVLEKFDSVRGSGSGEGKPKDWRAMLAEGVVQRGPEILKEVREIVATNRDTAAERRAAAEAQARTMEIARTMPHPQNGAAPATAEPAAALPTSPLRVVPIDGAAAAPPANPTPAPQPSAPGAPVAAPGMSASESDAVAAFMKRRIVEMIAEGRDAEDVVDFIEDVDPTVNDMLANFSADMVTTFLTNDSVLSKATVLPGWNIFLVNAQTYIKDIRAEDAAIETTAAAVPS